jgi:hypothetical protein
VRHYLDRERVGHALIAPAGILGPDTLVQPDVFVVTLGMRGPSTGLRQGPALVAEVLSLDGGQTSSQADQYQALVGLWIVDPEEARVEVWGPDDVAPSFERERVVWQPAGAARPFELDLPALFRPI